MNADDLIALNEEIAGMARAGLPLDQGLAAMAREMGRGRLRKVTSAIAVDLQAGRTLPEALQRQEGRVPPFYAGLVSAGVRTGRVTEVLATLTIYARSLVNLRTIIADALFYPAVVLLFGVVVVFLFCFFLLPQFEQIFRDFNMKLPAVTTAVLALGRHPIEYLLAPLAVIAGALFVLRFILGFTEPGRRAWTRMVYAVPIVGTLIRSARLAAFTDLLGILVDHNTPLPEAFRLAGAASSDPLMADMSQRIHHDLSQGMPLGEALRDGGLVPKWVTWMAGQGERRGALGGTLHEIAEMYRRQVEMRAAVLRSVLPPFLVIWTAGIFVALFAFAMFLPMFKLLEGLAK